MNFAKLRQSGEPAPSKRMLAGGKRVTGIVKVRRDGYRPDRLQVRSELGRRMFTAEFDSGDLAAIESDPQVEAVSLTEILPLQKLP